MSSLDKVTMWEGTPDGVNSLEDVVNVMLKPKDDVPQKGGNATYVNIEVTQPMDEIKCQKINGITQSYAKLDFSFDLESQDNDTINCHGYVIAFSSSEHPIRYFVNEGSTMAQKVLQLLFDNYNKATFVQEFKKDNRADFLFWLFANYIDNNGELDQNNSNNNIQIRNVNAIKGSMSEKITTLSAKSTDDIANYISVLSFLLETDEVDKLGLAIKDDDNELVEFVIDRPRTNQTVAVDTSSYIGIYSDKDIDERTCLVLFLVHLQILPQLRSLYSLHEDSWIHNERDLFLQNIADQIKARVDTLTSNLSSKLSEVDKQEA